MTQATTGTSTEVYIAPPAGTVFDGYTLIEEVSDIQLIRGWDAVEVTNFNSLFDKEHIKGLRNPGRYTVRGNWIVDAPGQNILRAAFEEKRRPYRFQVLLPPNPGSTLRESWAFNALVLSSDPLRLAPGKKIEFESLLQATGRRTPFPTYVNAAGQIGFTSSRPLGQTINATMWSGFQVSSAMPANAAIVAMYPVLVCSANYDGTPQYLQYGPSMSLGNPNSGTAFGPFGGTTGAPEASFASTLCYGASIGTTLASLTNQNIRMLLNTSLFLDGLNDLITATAAGIAIYYESDAALTDTQIPSPFTVPDGQGVAWALPFGVSVIGPNSQGFSIGTPARAA